MITLIEAIASAYTQYIRPAMREGRSVDDAAVEALMQGAGWCPRPKPQPARDVVAGILADLQGRKGFAWWWHDIDPDTKREIEDALTDVVRGDAPRASRDAADG